MGNAGIYAKPRQIVNLEECDFYHHMDLPGVGEVGQGWDLRKTADQYLGNLDFSGKRALDVGTASGFLTFSMEARGAEVVSFDLSDPSHANIVPYLHPRFPLERMTRNYVGGLPRVANAYWYAHRALGSKARVFYGNVNDLPDALGMFDIVVVGMILPHLRDPFQALCSASRRCSDTLVLTQQALSLSIQPYALFMPNVRVDPENFEHYLFWWALSERCLINMLEVLGFRVISNTRGMHRCTGLTRGDSLEECLTLVARRIGPEPSPGVIARSAPDSRSSGTGRLLLRLRGATGRATDRIADLVERLDQFDIRWLLGANTVLALLLLVAYGGGLLLAGLSGGLSGNPLPNPFLPALGAIVAIALSAVAFPAPAARAMVLKAHGLLFIGLAAYLTYCSALVIVDGVPTGARLSWDPLLFAVLATYSVYLARRVFLPHGAIRNALLKYSHLAVLVLSALLSALVLWRVYAGAT